MPKSKLKSTTKNLVSLVQISPDPVPTAPQNGTQNDPPEVPKMTPRMPPLGIPHKEAKMRVDRNLFPAPSTIYTVSLPTLLGGPILGLPGGGRR